MQDGGGPPNQFTDSRSVTVASAALTAPVFGQLVYSVTRPEGNYTMMVG